MAIDFSPIIPSHNHGRGDIFSVSSVSLKHLGDRVSPIMVLDQFRVSGRPFGPHPHAGFAAITYVLEDSLGFCRSRDTLGNDLVVGPGGICWAQSGSGMIHEEVPENPSRELHGIQLFVNLSSKNKLIAPKTLSLQGSDVPVWQNDIGDRIRVVVGSYEGVSSPLAPIEPFTFLDAKLARSISFHLSDAHNAVAYVLSGEIRLDAADHERKVAADQAIALHGRGGGGSLTLTATNQAHVLILSGREILEPVVAEGPFIMNDRAQIDAAFARYKTGQMGRLTANRRA